MPPPTGETDAANTAGDVLTKPPEDDDGVEALIKPTLIAGDGGAEGTAPDIIGDACVGVACSTGDAIVAVDTVGTPTVAAVGETDEGMGEAAVCACAADVAAAAAAAAC